MNVFIAQFQREFEKIQEKNLFYLELSIYSTCLPNRNYLQVLLQILKGNKVSNHEKFIFLALVVGFYFLNEFTQAKKYV